ncbi:UDP-N-acetylmuramoyl-L-alanyl-D-glutamate--L-lysine ligase, partial [Enterococcus faecalis]|nr:UDP-N-acetylmuramoyl-L-alanyl-D-glutamate--L-lysine ligase [Enterococcus faecalis]
MKRLEAKKVMISLFAIRDCLEKEELLKEFISPEGWHLTHSDTLGQREVTALSYDSR